jgi:hypothetical protein
MNRMLHIATFIISRNALDRMKRRRTLALWSSRLKLAGYEVSRPADPLSNLAAGRSATTERTRKGTSRQPT